MKKLFNDANLAQWLDVSDETDFDLQDFGIVRMNYDATVLAYNNAECAIAGVAKENAIAKNFFTQVAPCTNNFMVAEKYKNDTLDETLPYMFTYITKPTKVLLRLIKSNNGYQYLLAQQA